MYCTTTVLWESEFHNSEPVQDVLLVPICQAHTWSIPDHLFDNRDHCAVHHNWIVSNHNWWERVVLIPKVQTILIVWNPRSLIDYCVAYIYNAAA